MLAKHLMRSGLANTIILIMNFMRNPLKFICDVFVLNILCKSVYGIYVISNCTLQFEISNIHKLFKKLFL